MWDSWCAGHQNAQEIHPTHAFLVVPDRHDDTALLGSGPSSRQERVDRDGKSLFAKNRPSEDSLKNGERVI